MAASLITKLKLANLDRLGVHVDDDGRLVDWLKRPRIYPVLYTAGTAATKYREMFSLEDQELLLAWITAAEEQGVRRNGIFAKLECLCPNHSAVSWQSKSRSPAFKTLSRPKIRVDVPFPNLELDPNLKMISHDLVFDIGDDNDGADAWKDGERSSKDNGKSTQDVKGKGKEKQVKRLKMSAVPEQMPQNPHNTRSRAFQGQLIEPVDDARDVAAQPEDALIVGNPITGLKRKQAVQEEGERRDIDDGPAAAEVNHADMELLVFYKDQVLGTQANVWRLVGVSNNKELVDLLGLPWVLEALIEFRPHLAAKRASALRVMMTTNRAPRTHVSQHDHRWRIRRVLDALDEPEWNLTSRTPDKTGWRELDHEARFVVRIVSGATTHTSFWNPRLAAAADKVCLRLYWLMLWIKCVYKPVGGDSPGIPSVRRRKETWHDLLERMIAEATTDEAVVVSASTTPLSTPAGAPTVASSPVTPPTSAPNAGVNSPLPRRPNQTLAPANPMTPPVNMTTSRPSGLLVTTPTVIPVAHPTNINTHFPAAYSTVHPESHSGNHPAAHLTAYHAAHPAAFATNHPAGHPTAPLADHTTARLAVFPSARPTTHHIAGTTARAFGVPDNASGRRLGAVATVPTLYHTAIPANFTTFPATARWMAHPPQVPQGQIMYPTHNLLRLHPGAPLVESSSTASQAPVNMSQPQPALQRSPHSAGQVFLQGSQITHPAPQFAIPSPQRVPHTPPAPQPVRQPTMQPLQYIPQAPSAPQPVRQPTMQPLQYIPQAPSAPQPVRQPTMQLLQHIPQAPSAPQPVRQPTMQPLQYIPQAPSAPQPVRQPTMQPLQYIPQAPSAPQPVRQPMTRPPRRAPQTIPAALARLQTSQRVPRTPQVALPRLQTSLPPHSNLSPRLAARNLQRSPQTGLNLLSQAALTGSQITRSISPVFSPENSPPPSPLRAQVVPRIRRKLTDQCADDSESDNVAGPSNSRSDTDSDAGPSNTRSGANDVTSRMTTVIDNDLPRATSSGTTDRNDTNKQGLQRAPPAWYGEDELDVEQEPSVATKLHMEMPDYKVTKSSTKEQQKGAILLTQEGYRAYVSLRDARLHAWGVTAKHSGTCVLVPGKWALAKPMDIMKTMPRGENLDEKDRLMLGIGDYRASWARIAAWYDDNAWPDKPRRGIDLDGLILAGSDMLPMYTGSHLCHQPLCVVSAHVVFEKMHINLDRNDCAQKARRCRAYGGEVPAHCDKHSPPCLLQHACLTPYEAELIQFDVLRKANGLPDDFNPRKPANHPQLYRTFECRLPLTIPGANAVRVEPENLFTGYTLENAEKSGRAYTFTCEHCVGVKNVYKVLPAFWSHIKAKHSNIGRAAILEYVVSTAKEYTEWIQALGYDYAVSNPNTWAMLQQALSSGFDWEIFNSWRLHQEESQKRRADASRRQLQHQ